ncbi:MAG: flavodoxin-dependent (E)-4-hydroxy-3-methylbut-2-enyl-diphosphate synthase [Elusimicrobia bacterium]|nr:flavodoxin-dependent (E)-4-hydroxy-3-methylbut-2-enyl-diphosphate synthase [Elusimicrobiota bacterium]
MKSGAEKVNKKIVRVGNVTLGGKSPPAVQGMVKTKPSSVKTVNWIKKMEDAGCRMVRIAVPDEYEAGFISKIKRKIKIPLIADIHFDWRLALKAVDEGADKIRINPSNIGASWKVREVAKICNDHKIPIRVGANIGSVKEIKKSDSTKIRARKLFNAVAKEVAILEKSGFSEIVVSAKAEDVPTTIEANHLLAKFRYPIHIGVTATGLPEDGIVKSGSALGQLLREGIGDTIRVSLVSDPVYEVKVAYSILSANTDYKSKINFIACPTCGRCKVDLEKILMKIKSHFPDSSFPCSRTLDVAVMGCEVNGPGEAKNADIGIAFSGKKVVYFEKGKIKKTLPKKSAISFLTKKIKQFLK